MKIHIPAFQAMAKCNQHLDHEAFDIEISDEALKAAGYVRVVRCRECKHMDTLDCPCSMLEGENVQSFGEMSFCSYGEPKEVHVEQEGERESSERK